MHTPPALGIPVGHQTKYQDTKDHCVKCTQDVQAVRYGFPKDRCFLLAGMQVEAEQTVQTRSGTFNTQDQEEQAIGSRFRSHGGEIDTRRQRTWDERHMHGYKCT